MTLLQVKNLTVRSQNKTIVEDLDITVAAGELHVLMGPNGSGKSTFCKALAGHPAYEIVSGQALWQDATDQSPIDLLQFSADERARRGLFLSYQAPIEVPGVCNYTFCQEAFSHSRGAAETFPGKLESCLTSLHLDHSFMERPLNLGLSGGERKKNEFLQLQLLDPKLALLDEIDSGLDVTALALISKEINQLRAHGMAFILVTHYEDMLRYFTPDHVHVLMAGRIRHTGSSELLTRARTHGFESLAHCAQA